MLYPPSKFDKFGPKNLTHPALANLGKNPTGTDFRDYTVMRNDSVGR